MVYLTVDKDGEENLWDFLPIRNEDGEYWAPIDKFTINATMPTGSIESLIDKRLTWDDDPYPIVIIDSSTYQIITVIQLKEYITNYSSLCM